MTGVQTCALPISVTIAEEEDEEEHLNSTQNPLDDNELSVLISTITVMRQRTIYPQENTQTHTGVRRHDRQLDRSKT